MHVTVEDLETMYRHCARDYFKRQGMPKKVDFAVDDKIYRFAAMKHYWVNGKIFPRIVFSRKYDLDEKTFRDTMVHEMIHLWLAVHKVKDNGMHGDKFKEKMNELNEKYGLNVEVSKDASPYLSEEDAHPSLFKSLLIHLKLT